MKPNSADTHQDLQVLAIGETMMAFEALEPGPLRETRLFKKWIGGSEDNFVIGLARLGHRCGWMSRLGTDEFGREILRTIRGEGVDTSRVIMDPDGQTGVFFVEPRAEGDPHCYYYRRGSAASRLDAPDLDADYIGGSRVLFLTGITPAISESARRAAGEFFRIGRERGCTLLFDPNLRLKLWDIAEARRVLIPLMRQADHVLPGSGELRLLMDCPSLDEAVIKAHAEGIGSLVIKTGEEGALVSTIGGGRHKVPPFKVRNPVSSMGAGDCFAAGFTAGLLKDLPLAECARWGNALGAFCLMGSGPYQTLPEMPEFLEFLNGGEPVTR